MKKAAILILVAVMAINLVLVPSAAQAVGGSVSVSIPTLGPEIRAFLAEESLTPSHYDEEGNLVVYDAAGQKGIISKNLLQQPAVVQGYLDHAACLHAHELSPDMEQRSVCFALMYMAVWVATNWDTINFIYDVCSEVYSLINTYGIVSGEGTHLQGQPYEPFYPYPHFVIHNGMVTWN